MSLSIERTAEHRYFLTDEHEGRREAIGVTRALVEANLVDDEYFTDRSRGRGKLVHLFAEMILTNALNRPVDQSVVNYLIGLRKFLDMYAPIVHAAEIVLAHAMRLLAGTVDLDVHIFGAPATIEIKTSNPSPWHGLQLAPYSYLLDGPKWSERQRFGLYLNDRGGFRLKEYDDVSDLDYFFRAHETLAWRVNHGTFERPYGRRPIDAEYSVATAGIGSGDPFANDSSREWRDGIYGDPPEAVDDYDSVDR